MAIIPAGEKVLMTGADVNTVYGGSAALQEQNKWYTIEDIAESVGGGGGGGATITVEAIGGTFAYPGDGGGMTAYYYTNIKNQNTLWSGTLDMYKIPMPTWDWNGYNFQNVPTATEVIISKAPISRFIISYMAYTQKVVFSDLEAFVAANAYGNNQASIILVDCPLLQEVFFPKVKSIAAVSHFWSGNAFSQETVDYILNLFALYADQFVPGGGQMNPTLSISGGTSASPSPAAQPDIATLALKGWYLQYN